MHTVIKQWKKNLFHCISKSPLGFYLGLMHYQAPLFIPINDSNKPLEPPPRKHNPKYNPKHR